MSIKPTTPTLIPVAHISQIIENEPFGFQVEGVELVAVKTGDAINVYQGHCPHQMAMLSEGKVHKGNLICHMHGWTFDCASGEKVNDDSVCLRKFKSRVDDDRLLIETEDLRSWVDAKQEKPLKEVVVRNIDELPGPKGVPLLGNIHQIDLKKLHQSLETWSQAYGSLYKIKFGKNPVVVTTDPELGQQILKQRPEGYRRLTKMDNVIQEAGIHGVFNAEGTDWKKQRRITAQSLNVGHLKEFFPTLIKVARKLKKRWDKSVSTEGVIDIQNDLMRFTVDVTTNLAFGYNMNTLDEESDAIQAHLEKVFPSLFRRINAPIPYWRYFKMPTDRAFERSMAAIKEKVVEFISTTREKMKSQPELYDRPTNFLEALLAESRKEDTLSDHEIVGNVFTMLLAGEDTTAHSLSWMVYYMCLNPEVQRKMQEEADHIIPNEDGIAEGYDQIGKLSYIEAVAHESMRLKPVAPLLFFEPLKDVVLGDVNVPRGTGVVVQTRYAVLQDEHFTKAAEFLPERWLSDRDDQFEKHNVNAFVPFGGGPRYCPGRSLALTEIKMVAAMLCRHFDISLVTEPGNVEEIMAFAMMPGKFSVKLSPRQK
ncbi:MAG: cytochrome P450 [Bacteroidota bacterium]